MSRGIRVASSFAAALTTCDVARGQTAIADLMTVNFFVDEASGRMQRVFAIKEKYGSLVGVPGDRKRGTGGRSRTLAPPRGAAWIVDCSLALGFV